MAKQASNCSSRARASARRTVYSAVIAAAVGVCAVGGAEATIINFSATIDGAQETPPTSTGAMATGVFQLDTVANTLTINIVILVPPPSGEAAAHIHGPGAPGVPAGIIFPLPLGSPKNAVWNMNATQEQWVIDELTYVNIHSADFLGGEIRGQIVRVPSCGDGFVDGGEQCDDGNNTNGDCCNAACQFEPPGSPCPSPGLCGINAQCDGLGACVNQLATGCKVPGKSKLLIKNDASNDNKDKMLFKWLKGPSFTIGTPDSTTSYALCIYAGTAAIASADVPPSALLWTVTPPDAKYSDPDRTQDGIGKIILKKSTTAGKAKAITKGKGPGLPDPPTGPLALPVTAQLLNSTGECLEAVYSTFQENSAGVFKAKQ